jgi:hypothetical protein
MSEQEQQYVKPLPTGTRLIYYNKAQCREMEAIVKDAGLVILWMIDQEKSEADEHYIAYEDIVKILEYPLFIHKETSK